jgi:predicted TIM-barrel fold metal-dependent hydrolase
MAVWLYEIHRVELRSDTNIDEEIKRVLRDYGTRGWELAQMLPAQDVSGDRTYRFIFKTQKPLD